MENSYFDKHEIKKIIGQVRRSSILRDSNQYQGSLYRDLVKTFEKYQNFILDCDDNGPLSQNLKNNHTLICDLCNALLEVMQAFLTGDVRRAYNIFSDMLDRQEVIDCFNFISKPLGEWARPERPLYRVRASSRPLEYREDIFHIPFNMRHLVQTQRYSIAGLPCLYLGTSLYICWQEVGKPDFDKLYVSALYATSAAKELNILNFAYNLNTLADYRFLNALNDEYKNDGDINNILLSHLILWPLVASCSYIKNNESGAFNQEYIIPNLLMQKIASERLNNISGIAYLSTKSVRNTNANLGVNIIIPPKSDFEEMQNNKYCSILSNSFLMTTPISWQLLEALTYDYKVSNGLSLTKKIENIHETLMDDYHFTTFYKLEEKLKDKFQFRALNSSRIV